VPIGYIGFHFDFTVIVEDDMQASVAAVILSKFLVQIVLTLCGGEDGSSVVSPQGSLPVGRVYQKGIALCSGDNRDALESNECYPTGKYQLLKGDHIDLGWRMTTSGSVAYTIWPSD
jgi:hypothetical protein